MGLMRTLHENHQPAEIEPNPMQRQLFEELPALTPRVVHSKGCAHEPAIIRIQLQ